MGMVLAIDAPGTALGNAVAHPARRTPQASPEAAKALPPIGAGDPAVDIDGPAPFIPITRARIVRSRYQWVDALVTIAVMVWLTAALGWMVVEAHGATSAPVAENAVTKAAPAAIPQVSARPAAAAGAGSTSI